MKDLIRRGLKVSQIRLLAALRETGQISAAAQTVGITQPAASRLLGQLEDLVGAPLHERHPRGIALTEAGRILADEAVSTLRGFDLASQRIGEAITGLRGAVRIGSVTGPSLEIVLPALKTARRSLPRVEISVMVDTSDRLSDALLGGDIDFYIGRLPHQADARSFTLEAIGPEPISLVVRQDHPLTRVAPLEVGRCLDYDWVLQPPGGLLRRTVETYLMERGFGLPDRVIGTTSQLFTLALVHETDAIAPLARAVADFFIDRGALGSRLDRLPVAADLRVADYGLILRAAEALSPAASGIRSLLSAAAARQTRA